MDRDSTGFVDAQGTPIHEADVVAGPLLGSGPMAGTGKVVFRGGRFWVEFGRGAAPLDTAVAARLEVIGHSRDDTGE